MKVEIATTGAVTAFRLNSSNNKSINIKLGKCYKTLWI